MDSSPGQLGTPGSRTSSVLPDLLTQVSDVLCKFKKLCVIDSDCLFCSVYGGEKYGHFMQNIPPTQLIILTVH